ncbi:hypothetical protein N9W11_03675 [Psychrosphaera haliotis]|nr:hypothetical protein [Psychrosphaera haliotis]
MAFSKNIYQQGILFNHLPELLLFKSKMFASDTDFLLKTAQFKMPNNNITRDHQFFRNAAKGELSLDGLFQYFDMKAVPNNLKQDNEVDLQSVGGWHFLISLLAGFQSTLDNELDADLNIYLNFVKSICELDKQMIESLLKTKNVDVANNCVSEWLVLKEFDFLSLSKEQKAEYSISLVLFWAGLYEKYLKIEYSNSSDPYQPKMTKYLPKLKSGNLQFSTECMLCTVKNKWEENRPSNKKNNWSEFYSDIARAQLTNTYFNEIPLLPGDPRLIQPDITKIKKQFQRWRAGKNFSIDHAKKYLFVLYGEYDPNKIDSSVFMFVFIDIFTFIQKELLSQGVSPQVIVDKFNKYSVLLNLLESKFDEFTDQKRVK